MLSWGLYVEQAGDVQLQMNETLSCSGASEEKELAERERERLSREGSCSSPPWAGKGVPG